MRKSVWTWKCPKCGTVGGADVAPSAPPWCYNPNDITCGRKGTKMVFDPSNSKNQKEPDYKKKEK